MISFSEALSVYERFSIDPRATFSDIARLESWRMKNGQPYHVKVARIVRKLEKLGCVERDRNATSRRGQSLSSYKPIRAPAEMDFLFLKVPGQTLAKDKSKPREGIYFAGRYLRNAADVWVTMRKLAFVARKLPQSPADFADES